ncbi:MAG: DegT/DnrJ/EryC1/StrS family aminotransferase [Chloroflexi bacterium]|nr:DegT/DnrJ/EryC1/StrS family aminotransferase [Chloroflexota bacterium]
MNVPFVDLKKPHAELRTEILEAFERILDRADFVLGQDVTAFEEEFAAFCGAEHAIGVASGLAALELCLRAFDIGPGDEVIIPAHTFVATAAAVTLVGATPVLVDVDPITYNIDVAGIERAISPRSRAIIPVHLYGLPADMEAIMALAARYNLAVIEDACQSHGAVYKNRRTGTLGHAAAFSFYPTKNLGGCGDGGMVVTGDKRVAEAIRAMRNCGQKAKNKHEFFPHNYRLDSLQAALLRIKLRHLDDWNHARRQAAERYTTALAGSSVAPPSQSPDSTHVYHLYVVRTAQRDSLRDFLKAQGVATAIHYPLPIHQQPFFNKAPIRYDALPHSETICNEILSLPMFPEISEDAIAYVIDCVHRYSPVRTP